MQWSTDLLATTLLSAMASSDRDADSYIVTLHPSHVGTSCTAGRPTHVDAQPGRGLQGAGRPRCNTSPALEKFDGTMPAGVVLAGPGRWLNMLQSTCTLLVVQWAYQWRAFDPENVAAACVHMQSPLLCTLLFPDSPMPH